MENAAISDPSNKTSPSDTSPSEISSIKQPVHTNNPAISQEETQKKPTQAKKSGIFNIKTCCMGSCLGCFALSVLLVATAILAGPTLAKALNKFINPDIDVPEIEQTVNLDKVHGDIDIAASGGQSTLNIAENEFNVFLNEYITEMMKDAPDQTVDIRADFEQEKATFYLKVTDWMPWAIVNVIENQTNESIEIQSVNLGPFDITKAVKQAIAEQIQKTASEGETTISEQYGIKKALALLLLGESANKLDIQTVHFYQNRMEILVVPIEPEPSEHSQPILTAPSLQ